MYFNNEQGDRDLHMFCIFDKSIGYTVNKPLQKKT